MSSSSALRSGVGSQRVADVIAPVLSSIVALGSAGGEVPVRFVFWDGSSFGPADAIGVVTIRSADAMRRFLWSPNELGLVRAHIAGELDVSGDFIGTLDAIWGHGPRGRRLDAREVAAALGVARRIGAIGRPLPAPPEEAHPRGLRRHTIDRDAQAIAHHYDVGNDFYRLLLGPSMTYSCARFDEPDLDLAEAQASKHDLVCRKLGLHERVGQRLLDVGCGWGSMAIHAASRHGAQVVGITISEAQAEVARRRVAEAGVADRVDIRLQDYRLLNGEQFDAISSIGMSEHVGDKQMAAYFGNLRASLGPHGRLLNHAISKVGGSQLGRRSFIYRYVFPDGELLDVGDTVLAMERAGFEVRDVESLREHYAVTLRAWVANLEQQWDRAVELVGERRAKVWRLYMAASALSFERNAIAIHQVLGVVAGPDGSSAMAPTRDAWTTVRA